MNGVLARTSSWYLSKPKSYNKTTTETVVNDVDGRSGREHGGIVWDRSPDSTEDAGLEQGSHPRKQGNLWMRQGSIRCGKVQLASLRCIGSSDEPIMCDKPICHGGR